jgi:hypothetical protein
MPKLGTKMNNSPKNCKKLLNNWQKASKNKGLTKFIVYANGDKIAYITSGTAWLFQGNNYHIELESLSESEIHEIAIELLKYIQIAKEY